ncbi:MAG: efflux RND transporter permease subunit [Sulfuriflexus sp.]|nr:efflux RND transporter permease subunit [Sulfuriflexus sp.]
MIPDKLNLPGAVASYFIESKLTVLMMLALLCFGVIGLMLTPREENPQIVVPAAEVTISLPGASPLEIEHLLLSPLESNLASIDGVKHVYGTAHEGMASVVLEFEVGEDKDDAITRLYDHVLRNKHRLPPGSGEPVIQAIDIDDVPVFAVTLSSEQYTDHELRRMAERMLERLRGVKGTGIGYVVGGLQREIRIETQPELLQSYSISIDQIAMAIRNSNIDKSLGIRVYQQENKSLRIDGLLKDAEQIGKIVIHSDGSQVVRVADLANVVYGPPNENTQMTRFAFGPADPRFSHLKEPEIAAVTLAIAKRTGFNSVDLTNEFRQRVNQMKQGFLPPNVNVVITRDDGIKADQTVTQLVEHLLIAIAAVAVILLIFLGRWAALIVSITIPLVFSVVIGADLLAGPTLNRITLYALILGLGMLVDDAIVVIENIHRHFDQLPPNADRASRAKAAILATAEIGNPTTLATFTVVTVFLSLNLITGMLGEYFYPMAFNVPVAMVASLIIAYSVTPWLARRWLLTSIGHAGPHKNEHLRGEEPSRLQNVYRKVITLLLEQRRLRKLFYIGVATLLVLSFLQPAWQFIRPQGITGAVSPLGVPLAFLPKDNKNTFLIHLHLPENTPLEITDRAARELGQLLRQQSIVSNYQTFVGIPSVIDFNGQLSGSAKQVGPQFADIRVNLTNKFERSESSIDLVRALRSKVEKIAARYPGGIFQLIEDPPGPPVRATVLAEVYGPELKVLDQLAMQIESEFIDTYDMVEIQTSIPTNMVEYRFKFQRDKIALAGLDSAIVSRVLDQLMKSTVLGYAHPEGERSPVPVKLHIPRQHRIDPDMLERAFVTNSNGKSIPLSELVYVEKAVQSKPINHKNSERVHYIGGELSNSAPVYAVLDLDRRLDEMEVAQGQKLTTANLGFLPVRANTLEGYKLLWEGELRLTLDAFRDMGLALGMALLVIYLLLVGYYRSFSLPLLALTAVPLAMIGVFPAHWVFGVSFSAASMVGVIALAGVVVRNSLLIIDFIQDYQKQGYDLDDAVREAGAIRLRPILLTTLAIALGTAIMVPDAVFGGLALALIFGAISSALLVIIIVPLLYRRMMQE